MLTIPLPIALLAGGRSSRMGADKALLPVGGVPMLHRLVQVARSVSPRVLIVGRQKPAHWPADLPATFLPDTPLLSPLGNPQSATDNPSHGPLVGLITALEHTRAPTLLLPCDTPLLSAALLHQLVAAHTPEHLATIAATPNGPEPLLAVYTPALLPILRQMLAENRRALHPLVHASGVGEFPIPPEHLPELLNVNTPADVNAAAALLDGRSGNAP